MSNLSDVRVVVCDTGGTIFDWFTPVADALRSCGEEHGVEADWAGAARRWRVRSTGVYKVGTPRDARGSARDMDDVLRDTLAPSLDDVGARLPETATGGLVAAWRRMPVWPDVPEGVAALRAVLPVAPFTILRTATVVEASRLAGVTWDTVISCESFGVYKTHPDSYRWAARLLDVSLPEMLLVTTHNNDLEASSELGMRTAFIHRDDEWGGQPSDDPHPSPRADVTVRALHELVPLLRQGRESRPPAVATTEGESR